MKHLQAKGIMDALDSLFRADGELDADQVVAAFNRYDLLIVPSVATAPKQDPDERESAIIERFVASIKDSGEDVVLVRKGLADQPFEAVSVDALENWADHWPDGDD